MSDESQVRAWLVAHAGTNALVSGRVYPDIVDTSKNTPVSTPYIVYTLASETPLNSLTCDPTLSNLRVQLDLYADTKAGVAALRDQVRAALLPNGQESASFSGFEDDARLYRLTMDWSFWLER